MCSPSKWSRPAPDKVAGLQCGDQRVGVVQHCPRGVQEDRPVLHRLVLRCRDQPLGLGRHDRVHRHDVALAEHREQFLGGVVRGLRVVRVVREDAHPEPFEAPRRGAADRAQPDDSRGPAGELPGAVALIGDLPGGVHLVGAHVGVGRDDEAVDREHQRHRQLRDRVGVAARGAQHRDAGRGRGRDVDVVGVAPARPDRDERHLEHGSLHRVGLDDEHVGALGSQPLGELLAVVDAQRDLLDPGVVHHVGDAPERVHPLAPEGRGHQCLVSIRHVSSSPRC